MDLRQLRYFVAIVEQGSFSKAASVLNIAQPALSLHVRNMEADLGTSLLFRNSTGVVATEAGEILLRHARFILDRVFIAEEEIRGHKAEPSGEVRLGLPGTISEIISVPLILEARKRYPHIKLCIAEAMSGFVMDWLRDNRIDLAVLYTSIEDRDILSYPVLTQELCLFGPVKLSEGTISPEDRDLTLKRAAELPLILPSRGHGLRDLLEQQASDVNLSLNTVIDVDSYRDIKMLVTEAIGFSILPYNAIAHEVDEGQFRVWSVKDSKLERDIHLAYAVNRPKTNATAVIETLCHEIILNLDINKSGYIS